MTILALQDCDCGHLLQPLRFHSRGDELIRLQGRGKTARQMGHHPVTGTLPALAGINTRKIFIHINNTNPMLDEDSEECRSVRDAGWEIGFDGMDLVL